MNEVEYELRMIILELEQITVPLVTLVVVFIILGGVLLIIPSLRSSKGDTAKQTPLKVYEAVYVQPSQTGHIWGNDTKTVRHVLKIAEERRKNTQVSEIIKNN